MDGKRLKLDSSTCEDGETINASDLFDVEDSEMKRKKACVKQSDDSRLSDSRLPDTLNNSVCQLMDESHKPRVEKEAEYLARLAEMEILLREKEEHERQVKEELDHERKEKERQAKELEELRMREQTILLEMQEKQEQLEKERMELKLKIQAELEASVKERETALIAQLTGQWEMLLSEKRQESLQKEMEKARKEKNKELELLNQKQELEKMLEMKDIEQKLLENELNEIKQENVTAKLQVLKAREDILSSFVAFMEVEFQCAICSELFIEATSLNCSHVFCKFCINQWMQVKKECPTCRCHITSQWQAIALDSYIDKMVEQLDDERKQKRAVFEEQRKAEQAEFEVAEAGPSYQTAAVATPNTYGASSSTGNRRAVGRSRQSVTIGNIRISGNGSVRINGRDIDVGNGGSTTTIINGNIISRSHDQNSRSYDVYDSDFNEYDPDVYDNRCFICGYSGHRASGCPYNL